MLVLVHKLLLLHSSNSGREDLASVLSLVVWWLLYAGRRWPTSPRRLARYHSTPCVPPRLQVPERQLLCVWTQDSHRAGKSVILPYAAVSDIDIEVGRGCCCIPGPTVAFACLQWSATPAPIHATPSKPLPPAGARPPLHHPCLLQNCSACASNPPCHPIRRCQ